jgi:hypothetical protein
MSIYKKLLEIQKQVRGLGKDKKSGQGSFGYEYVTGAKILEMIKPIMNEQGLILKQEVLNLENSIETYKTNKGEKTEVLSKASLLFTWVDVETGEKDENKFAANGMNGFDKGLGSALTYAERYFLLKYFHIPTDEDDIDNPESKVSTTPAPPSKPISDLATQGQVKALQAKLKVTGVTEKQFKDFMTKKDPKHNYSDFNKFPKKFISGLMNYVDKKFKEEFYKEGPK